jgi:pimeloyl-ACP methyl ester carboxylesterase
MTEWFHGFVQANGLNISYHRTGGSDKPVIILLHGVMDNGLGWIPVARDLQEQFDVIMTDARGHGHTGGSLDNLSYQLLAADVAAFIQALDLEKPYLFGHSMGAMTAAMATANYPELVRAIVLEDPPFTDAAPVQAGGEPTEAPMLQFFQGILALRDLPPEQRLVVARQYNPLWDEVELAPWVESKIEFNLEIFQYLERVVPWREMLPRISCPILLVTGDPEAHAIVTPQIAQEAAHLWQHGEIIQIKGAGHCIHRDRYAETMPQIQAFLSRV